MTVRKTKDQPLLKELCIYVSDPNPRYKQTLDLFRRLIRETSDINHLFQARKLTQTIFQEPIDTKVYNLLRGKWEYPPSKEVIAFNKKRPAPPIQVYQRYITLLDQSMDKAIRLSSIKKEEGWKRKTPS